jgi:hypothetical protein
MRKCKRLPINRLEEPASIPWKSRKAKWEPANYEELLFPDLYDDGNRKDLRGMSFHDVQAAGFAPNPRNQLAS